jgi:hypothetical protein
MKITYKQYNAGKSNEFFEVQVIAKDEFGEKIMSAHAFDTKKEVDAFYSGFQSCRCFANSLIQSMPMSITKL